MVDITDSANAISGGDFPAFSKEEAFDNVVTQAQAWASSQTVFGWANTAYIGQDFGDGNLVRVDTINLWQHATTTANSLLGADVISFQYSDDGSTGWTELEKISPDTIHNYEHTVSAPEARRAWRLLALVDNPTIPGSVWVCREIEMHGELNPVVGGGGGGGGPGLRGRRRRRQSRWRD